MAEVQYFYDVVADLVGAWRANNALHRDALGDSVPPTDFVKVERLRRRLPRALCQLRHEVDKLPCSTSDECKVKAYWSRRVVLVAAFVHRVEQSSTGDFPFESTSRNVTVCLALEKLQWVYEESFALQIALESEAKLDTLLYALLGNLTQRISEVSDVLDEYQRRLVLEPHRPDDCDDIIFALDIIATDARAIGQRYRDAVLSITARNQSRSGPEPAPQSTKMTETSAKPANEPQADPATSAAAVNLSPATAVVVSDVTSKPSCAVM